LHASGSDSAEPECSRLGVTVPISSRFIHFAKEWAQDLGRALAAATLAHAHGALSLKEHVCGRAVGAQA